jgi:hypothetical protein
MKSAEIRIFQIPDQAVFREYQGLGVGIEVQLVFNLDLFIL